MNDKGYHYIIDMILKDEEILKNSRLLKKIFKKSLIEFKILKYEEYKFNTGGNGITAFFLLSESHCSYHTYPENKYIAIDIFTCGKNPIKAINIILANFSPSKVSVVNLERGSESINRTDIKENNHETCQR